MTLGPLMRTSPSSTSGKGRNRPWIWVSLSRASEALSGLYRQYAHQFPDQSQHWLDLAEAKEDQALWFESLPDFIEAGFGTPVPKCPHGDAIEALARNTRKERLLTASLAESGKMIEAL